PPYFLPRPQDFGDCPGLRDAAARRERSIAIENFAERAEAARVNLAAERLEEALCRFAVAVHAIVRERERPEQPAPDGALMISGVAIPGTTAVMAGISGFAGRETPQSMRGHETPRANVDNRLVLLGGQGAYRQGHGKNLIRPECSIISDARRIDDVEAAITLGVPESLKVFPCFGREFFVSIAGPSEQPRKSGHRFERVDPQRGNLHGFSR